MPILNPDGSGRSAGEGAIGSHNNRSLASLRKTTKGTCKHYSVQLHSLANLSRHWHATTLPSLLFVKLMGDATIAQKCPYEKTLISTN